MKNTNNNIIITLIALQFFFSSCEKDLTDKYVALVGNIPITEYEFTMRYNFNPYLAQYYNENEAKKVILSSLIAEKLLALESSNLTEISNDIITRIEQHKKEVIIEQFRRDSVENQIETTDAELQREYRKALQETDIKYIAFNFLEEALEVKQEIDNGRSFEKSVRKYMETKGWQNEEIPRKTVKWNAESYDTEEMIFSLNPGEASKPIKINGDYYLIKTEEIRSIQSPDKADYTNRLPALKDRILKEKIKKKYSDFFNKYIASRLGSINWEKLEDVFELITMDVEFNQKPSQAHLFSDDKALSDEVYLNYEARQEQIKNHIVAQFPDGSEWNMDELMTVLKNGPFSFSYRNKTEFKKSFRQNVLLALEYEAIYHLAKEAGYDANEYVLKDAKVWETYYRANEVRFQILQKAESDIYVNDSTQHTSRKQLTAKQQFRIEYLDKYISKLAENYKIQINQKKYNTIKLDKTNMVVMKTHFAHRLVAPMAEPLTGLPQWRAIINTILKKSGIS